MPCEADLLRLAQIGYRAYGNAADWCNYAGGLMPTWAELPRLQRESWVATAAAMHKAVMSGEVSGEQPDGTTYERIAERIEAVAPARAGCCRDGQGAGPGGQITPGSHIGGDVTQIGATQ